MTITSEELRSKGQSHVGCEDCRFYRMIDSGYGYCVRFPPRLVLVQWFPRVLYDAPYPHVGWDELPCGEFSKRRQNG